MKKFYRLPSLSKETIEFGQECKTAVKRYAPGIIDELRGIVDGGGYGAELLDAFILTLGFEYEHLGCTIFSVSGEYTTDQIPIFARNYDWFASFQKFFTVIWLNPVNHYSSLAFTDHFVGRYGGVNQEGLAIGITAVPGYVKRWVPGVRMNISTRWILDTCKNTKEVVSFLKKIPHVRAHTFLIADKENNLARVETSDDEVAVTYAENGFIVTTNHYQAPQLKKYTDDKLIPENSIIRLNKVHKWFENQNDLIDLEYIKLVLNDHEKGVCNHFEIDGAPSCTIWSWIAPLGKKEVYLADGSPCKNEYNPYKY